MHHLRRLGLILTILSVLVLALPGGSPGEASAQTPPDFAPGKILVKFKPGTSGQAVADAHRQNGGQVQKTIPGIDVHVVGVPVGQEAAKVAAYSSNPNVQFAELDGSYHVITYPNDPQYGQQWQYNNTGQTGGTVDADIDAFEAWNVTQGSSTVKIAILDTGIDQSHPDVGSKVTATKNFAGTADASDHYGHGTHVAGSAAAITNNATGVAGTCPNCSLYNYKVLDDSGSGAWDWIASGITTATDDGAQVISMSLGGSSGSSTVQSAVDYAWNSKNVVVVAAAGNNGNTAPSYPAYYSNAIAVAATDNKDAKASFSTYGSWVDVAAPGVSILSTAPTYSTKLWSGGTNGYQTLNGTSMATPHVAGIAGLVWSKSGLCSTNSCVRGQIENNADAISGTGSSWAKGRVNACKAIGGTCTGSASPSTPASITATAGSNQSATVGTAFSTALQATVKDSGNNPVSGVSVTFTAPGGTGPSGTFSGGSTTATATTNSSGVATAPTFTANSTAGSYTVTASVSGVASSASYSLTNTASSGSSTTVHVSSLAPSTTVLGNGWKATATITISDNNSNPVSGVSVSGSWSNGYSATGSCTTGSNGKCSITTGRIANSVSSVTFTVTNPSGAAPITINKP
jgi:thermitase